MNYTLSTGVQIKQENLNLAYNCIFEGSLFLLLGSSFTKPSKDTTSSSIQNKSILSIIVYSTAAVILS
jgi:hypothetical protein